MLILNNTVLCISKLERVDRAYVTETAENPLKKTQGTFGEVLGRFITLIVMMVSGCTAHAHIHQLVHIKYVQFFVYPLHLSKAIKKSTYRPAIGLLYMYLMINILL